VAFARAARVLIQIARLVRVTLSEAELQTLRPGEFYDVSPAVGRVLVGEGWAIEAEHGMREEWSSHAHDEPAQRATS
jgi:hypothetical protein